MILIDFGIICIGQSESSFPKNIKNVEFEVSKRTAQSKPMYNRWYHFHTADKLVGNWYQVWLPKDIVYDESFFDLYEKDGGYGNYICVESKWSNTVKNVLEFYIQESPAHQIAVLLRIEDSSDDITHPVCSLEEFMNDLIEGNIRFNELYFIEG